MIRQDFTSEKFFKNSLRILFILDEDLNVTGCLPVQNSEIGDFLVT